MQQPPRFSEGRALPFSPMRREAPISENTALDNEPRKRGRTPADRSLEPTTTELRRRLCDAPTFLCGPCYTRKADILEGLSGEVSSAMRANLGWLSRLRDPAATLQAQLNAAGARDASRPRLVLLDELENCLGTSLNLRELFALREPDDYWLVIANIPQALIDFAALGLNADVSSQCGITERKLSTTLDEMGVWQRAKHAVPAQAAAIRATLGAHPYLCRLLLEEILAKRLRVATDPAVLNSAWRELVNGPLRSFFVARLRDISQSRELLAGCRALFGDPASATPGAWWSAASPSIKAAYRWLVKWGIAQVEERGVDMWIEPSAPIFEAWLHADFASDLR